MNIPGVTFSTLNAKKCTFYLLWVFLGTKNIALCTGVFS